MDALGVLLRYMGDENDVLRVSAVQALAAMIGAKENRVGSDMVDRIIHLLGEVGRGNNEKHGLHKRRKNVRLVVESLTKVLPALSPKIDEPGARKLVKGFLHLGEEVEYEAVSRALEALSTNWDAIVLQELLMACNEYRISAIRSIANFSFLENQTDTQQPILERIFQVVGKLCTDSMSTGNVKLEAMRAVGKLACVVKDREGIVSVLDALLKEYDDQAQPSASNMYALGYLASRGIDLTNERLGRLCLGFKHQLALVSRKPGDMLLIWQGFEGLLLGLIECRDENCFRLSIAPWSIPTASSLHDRILHSQQNGFDRDLASVEAQVLRCMECMQELSLSLLWRSLLQRCRQSCTAMGIIRHLVISQGDHVELDPVIINELHGCIRTWSADHRVGQMDHGLIVQLIVSLGNANLLEFSSADPKTVRALLLYMIHLAAGKPTATAPGSTKQVSAVSGNGSESFSTATASWLMSSLFGGGDNAPNGAPSEKSSQSSDARSLKALGARALRHLCSSTPQNSRQLQTTLVEVLTNIEYCEIHTLLLICLEKLVVANQGLDRSIKSVEMCLFTWVFLNAYSTDESRSNASLLVFQSLSRFKQWPNCPSIDDSISKLNQVDQKRRRALMDKMFLPLLQCDGTLRKTTSQKLLDDLILSRSSPQYSQFADFGLDIAAFHVLGCTVALSGSREFLGKAVGRMLNASVEACVLGTYQFRFRLSEHNDRCESIARTMDGGHESSEFNPRERADVILQTLEINLLRNLQPKAPSQNRETATNLAIRTTAALCLAKVCKHAALTVELTQFMTLGKVRVVPMLLKLGATIGFLPPSVYVYTLREISDAFLSYPGATISHSKELLRTAIMHARFELKNSADKTADPRFAYDVLTVFNNMIGPSSFSKQETVSEVVSMTANLLKVTATSADADVIKPAEEILEKLCPNSQEQETLNILKVFGKLSSDTKSQDVRYRGCRMVQTILSLTSIEKGLPSALTYIFPRTMDTSVQVRMIANRTIAEIVSQLQQEAGNSTVYESDETSFESDTELLVRLRNQLSIVVSAIRVETVPSIVDSLCKSIIDQADVWDEVDPLVNAGVMQTIVELIRAKSQSFTSLHIDQTMTAMVKLFSCLEAVKQKEDDLPHPSSMDETFSSSERVVSSGLITSVTTLVTYEPNLRIVMRHLMDVSTVPPQGFIANILVSLAGCAAPGIGEDSSGRNLKPKYPVVLRMFEFLCDVIEDRPVDAQSSHGEPRNDGKTPIPPPRTVPGNSVSGPPTPPPRSPCHTVSEWKPIRNQHGRDAVELAACFMNSILRAKSPTTKLYVNKEFAKIHALLLLAVGGCIHPWRRLPQQQQDDKGEGKPVARQGSPSQHVVDAQRSLFDCVSGGRKLEQVFKSKLRQGLTVEEALCNEESYHIGVAAVVRGSCNAQPQIAKGVIDSLATFGTVDRRIGQRIAACAGLSSLLGWCSRKLQEQSETETEDYQTMLKTIMKTMFQCWETEKQSRRVRRLVASGLGDVTVEQWNGLLWPFYERALEIVSNGMNPLDNRNDVELAVICVQALYRGSIIQLASKNSKLISGLSSVLFPKLCETLRSSSYHAELRKCTIKAIDCLVDVISNAMTRDPSENAQLVGKAVKVFHVKELLPTLLVLCKDEDGADMVVSCLKRYVQALCPSSKPVDVCDSYSSIIQRALHLLWDGGYGDFMDGCIPPCIAMINANYGDTTYQIKMRSNALVTLSYLSIRVNIKQPDHGVHRLVLKIASDEAESAVVRAQALQAIQMLFG